MPFLAIIIPLGLLLATISSAAFGQPSDPAMPTLEMVLSAARRLDEQFSRVRASVEIAEQKPGGKTIKPASQGRIAIDHGMEKVTLQYPPHPNAQTPDSYEVVACLGDDSMFQIGRISQDGPYTVEKTGSDSFDRSYYTTKYGRFLRACRGVVGLPLSKLLSRDDLRDFHAEPIRLGDRNLTKLAFDIGDGASKAGCSVVADHDAGWIVRSSEYRMHNSNTVWFKADISYELTDDGVHVPSSVTLRDWDGKVTVWKYSDWSFAPTPEEEFSLEFYGLPDLVVRRHSQAWLPWMWIGLGLFASTIVAGTILWRGGWGKFRTGRRPGECGAG